ncbi:hypothetical protein [Candidatus Lokiarchaeum ossiferum]|uniref:hypothetical protein n=1 Tax=Candidatus Lokiarchaeum ossiferum TaxID=2951803 RepID=UPI00352E0788
MDNYERQSIKELLTEKYGDKITEAILGEFDRLSKIEEDRETIKQKMRKFVQNLLEKHGFDSEAFNNITPLIIFVSIG